MGAGAYDIILDYDHILDHNAIVELGANSLGPGGDGSTSFFAAYLFNKPTVKFYTVDSDPGTIHTLDRYQKLMPDRFHAWCGDALEMLDQITEPVAFAYLDNFDYIPPGCEDADWMLAMIENYRTRWGIELNNTNSAQAHLAQTKKIVEMAADQCVILFDDTWNVAEGKTFAGLIQPGTDHQDWYGKGATAVPWLLSQGWSVIKDACEFRPRDDWTALRNW